MTSTLAAANPVEELWREHAVPGVAVGLIADGEEWRQGFGVTNVDHPLPVDPDTLFQIGSITKTFKIIWLRIGGRIHRRLPRTG